jgi:hypothetical protein
VRDLVESRKVHVTNEVGRRTEREERERESGKLGNGRVLRSTARCPRRGTFVIMRCKSE